MNSGFVDTVNGFLSAGSAVAIPAVAAIGFFSTLRNPCAMPLYPAATDVCITSTPQKQRTSFINAAAFVVGMAIAIAVLGLGAAAAGRVIGVGRGGRYLIACLPLLMGVHRLGWIKLGFFKFKSIGKFKPGILGAFATGLLLSLVIGRCGGTVLGTVLAYAAYHKAFLYGGILLFAYGIGAGIPLVTLGTVVGRMSAWLEHKGYRKGVEVTVASTMLALGFYMFWVA